MTLKAKPGKTDIVKIRCHGRRSGFARGRVSRNFSSRKLHEIKKLESFIVFKEESKNHQGSVSQSNDHLNIVSE